METLAMPSGRHPLRRPALDKVQGTTLFEDGSCIANRRSFSRYSTALSFAIIWMLAFLLEFNMKPSNDPVYDDLKCYCTAVDGSRL